MVEMTFLKEPKECVICHYWYFIDKGFKFQWNVYNECHHSLMMSTNLSDIAFLTLLLLHY